MLPTQISGMPVLKRFYEEELETLRTHLIQMGEVAVRQVERVMRALVEGKAELAQAVIEDDDQLDRLEVLIDDEAVRYMNMRAPIASDLRLLVVGMKAGHDLERVGDEASNIAKRVLRLIGEPPLAAQAELPRMAGMAVSMLREALDCFLQGDAQKALGVCHSDAEVDLLNKQLYRDLSAMMMTEPAVANRALELIFISKSLERIADHATNIAEEMIYLAKGEDVRHTEQVKKA